jgi:hypothetical protein
MKIHVLWEVTPSWLVNSWKRFVGKKTTVPCWTARLRKCMLRACWTRLRISEGLEIGYQILRQRRKVCEYSFWQCRVPEEGQLNSRNACYHSGQNFYFPFFLFKPLTFWRRNYFFLILAHPVYKMWIIQEPNSLKLWNKRHFWRGKNGEYIPRLKYSVPIFVK